MAPFNLFPCQASFGAAAPVVASRIRGTLYWFLSIFMPSPLISKTITSLHLFLHHTLVLVFLASFIFRY
uniref:Uncharacterized protein n=1 Tax=Lotus japonicus TaxID=34305 RepID=I3SZF3_LOTJA|nr:unknown [Lotus japonicus]